MSQDDPRNETSLEIFVCTVFEWCAQMLLLSSMEKQLAKCNLKEEMFSLHFDEQS